MAFLCPVRIRRNKKKKDDGDDVAPHLGRITGSSSIETLVRVGLEKEAGISPDARMLVLHDFTPCVDDELEVKKGDLVSLLYRENDWAYVIDERRPPGQQNEGFIPYSYITPFMHDSNKNSSRIKKLPREENNSTTSSNATSLISGASTSSEVHPFFKDPSLGRFIVLYTFTARDENDIDVHRGELITVLNKDDADWFWIIRDCDGQEGFVPSAFIYPFVVGVSSGMNPNHHQNQNNHNNLTNGQIHQEPMPTFQLDSANNHNINSLVTATSALQISNHSIPNTGAPPTTNTISPSNYYSNKPKESDITLNQGCTASILATTNPAPFNTASSLPPNSSGPGQAVEKAGSELIMLYDYKAQVGDDLSVRRGDWVYADLTCQPVEGWLWAYAPKQRKYGFVPKAYARPPAMTSL